jgi:uncharacterized membrane protein YphA (DoxX/SURF4 family)
VIDWFEQRLAGITAAYAPDSRYLAVVRIAFGLWVIVWTEDITWTGLVPSEFFHAPPGPFWFMSGPPSDWFLVALMATKILLGIMLVFGIFTLPVSIALSVVLIVSAGIWYSYSKINHMILFEIAPIFLVFAGWGFMWSADAFRRRHQGGEPIRLSRGMPLLLFAMTIGWAYLSAAAPKIKNGWLDPSREATRGYLAREIYRDERPGPLGRWAFEIDSSLFWKLLDYATVVAEGGLIFVVFFPLLFRIWLVVLAAFHISVYLTLGIDFSDYLLVYAAFFSAAFVWLAANLRRVSFAREQTAAAQ